MALSEKDVAAHWNSNAATWADYTRRGFDVYRLELNNPALFDLLGDVRGREILDAGCGDGFNTRLIARRGARVTGVDISDEMLAVARDEENRDPLGISYEQRSVAKLEGFADASFDIVTSVMVLMDTPDLEAALAEFARVLRPSGALVFNILHPCFMTRGYKWIEDADREGIALQVSGYFDETSEWVDRWHFSRAGKEAKDFNIPRFHRTLSHYLNALDDAGFGLDRIQEPRASEEFARKYKASRWREHAAIFLQVRARKSS